MDPVAVRNSRKATATDRKHMSVLLARVVLLGGCADHWLATDLRDHEFRAVVGWAPAMIDCHLRDDTEEATWQHEMEAPSGAAT